MKIAAIDLNAAGLARANDVPEDTTLDLEFTSRPFSIRSSNSDRRLQQRKGQPSSALADVRIVLEM
jgi:hypothetical protein